MIANRPYSQNKEKTQAMSNDVLCSERRLKHDINRTYDDTILANAHKGSNGGCLHNCALSNRHMVANLHGVVAEHPVIV